MASKNFHSREYWEIKVQEWLSSGRSAKSWCKENQISYNTFLGWRARLEQNNQKTNLLKNADPSFSKPHFIELNETPKLSSGIMLEYNGIKIHLQPEFDAFSLEKCLNILRGAAC